MLCSIYVQKGFWQSAEENAADKENSKRVRRPYTPKNERFDMANARLIWSCLFNSKFKKMVKLYKWLLRYELE